MIKILKYDPVEIRSLSHDGRGISKVNQKTVFIAGALPQEKVTFTVQKKHKNYLEAAVETILEPSPQRSTPSCAHFGICGGCSLQHLDDQAEIELKQKIILEQLLHFGGITPQHILPPLSAETLGYRRKARLGVKFVIKKNKLLIGFREKATNYLADIDKCTTLHPMIGFNLDKLKTLISSLSDYHSIPQIEMAMGDEEVALVFRHLKPLSSLDKEKLIHFGQQESFQIYLQPNPPEKVMPLTAHQTDRLFYTLPDYGLKFLFHPLDFTQINLSLNRKMVAQAITLLDLKTNDVVLDLFCGIGNFSLPMAQQCQRVIGIEGSEAMVLRAKENSNFNGIKNAEFYSANLFDENFTLATQVINKILLDPPRAGAKEILSKLAATTATKIVYVSCNPATLARDCGLLVKEWGFELNQVGVMNMFPHTSHIEAMAVLTRK